MGEYFFVNRIVDTVPDRKTCSKYCLFKFLCARLFVMIMYQVLYSVYAFPNVWNYTEQNNIQLNILLMKTHKKQNQEFIWIFYIFNMYPPPPEKPLKLSPKSTDFAQTWPSKTSETTSGKINTKKKSGRTKEMKILKETRTVWFWRIEKR